MPIVCLRISVSFVCEHMAQCKTLLKLCTQTVHISKLVKDAFFQTNNICLLTLNVIHQQAMKTIEASILIYSTISFFLLVLHITPINTDCPSCSLPLCQAAEGHTHVLRKLF